MGNRRSTWRESFAALGQSLIEVVQAELAIIGEAWKGSFRHLAIVLGLFTAAGYVALVCLPALLIFALVFAVQDLLTWAFAFRGWSWPLWGSALVVAILVALVIYLVVKLALKRLHERFESPVAVVKHRVADHAAWWNERVLDGRERVSSEAAPEPDNDTAEAKGEADDAQEGHSARDDAGDR